jgi:hypothetical protein
MDLDRLTLAAHLPGHDDERPRPGPAHQLGSAGSFNHALALLGSAPRQLAGSRGMTWVKIGCLPAMKTHASTRPILSTMSGSSQVGVPVARSKRVAACDPPQR